MTVALLRFRPPTPSMLWDVLCAMRREDLQTAYMGDALWRIMRALYQNLDAPSYSEYTDMLDGNARPKDTRSGEEIIESVKERLRKRG